MVIVSCKCTFTSGGHFKVALVTWTEQVGVALVSRELTEMEIHAPCHTHLKYSILQVFPFTSDRKRMGIIVKVKGGERRSEGEGEGAGMRGRRVWG